MSVSTKTFLKLKKEAYISKTNPTSCYQNTVMIMRITFINCRHWIILFWACSCPIGGVVNAVLRSLWSLHASLFNAMQDLLETFESWQCLTWAVLITVMARILIKSLFTYPGAAWSLIGSPARSGTAASLVCVAMASLSQTAVPSSHSHGRYDKWRRTCG